MHLVDPYPPLPIAGGTSGDDPPVVAGADVVVYFGDDPVRLYQLGQWLPILERLDRLHRVQVLTRDKHTLPEVRKLTRLPCVLLPTFADLSEFYRTGRSKVVLYVNNSTRNFQSLTAQSVLHLHVNHGESDKVCMVSNQVKAYDRILVAGQAAIDRYRAALLDHERLTLVPIGRPQLDLRPTPLLPPSPRRTVLYAPTWEGEEPRNDYTSVGVLGAQVVARALAVPDVRLVYKPHPRILDSATAAIRAGHRDILRLVREAARRDPSAGHTILTGADILAVIPGCDLMITDVSSVGLDFLYLRPDRPLFVTDRYADRDRLLAESPVARCADVVDPGTIADLTTTLIARLAHDVHGPARGRTREYYFGAPGLQASTDRFLAAVADAVQARDRMLSERAALPALALAPAPAAAVVAGVGWPA